MILVKYICGSIRFLVIVLIMFIMLFSYIIGIKTFFKHTSQSGFKLRSIFLSIINPILGFNIIKEGEPIDEPALYISNHRGILDFFITMEYIKGFALSKAEVENVPLMGYSGILTGIIFVKRDNKSSRSAAREAIINTLKSGYNVIIYPEGTVNTNKTTSTFSIGSFEEVAKHGFPVVPIAMEYKSKKDLWTDEPMLSQFYNQFGKCVTGVKIAIGEPIKGENSFEIMNKSKAWIDSKLLEMQKNWSRAYDK